MRILLQIDLWVSRRRRRRRRRRRSSSSSRIRDDDHHHGLHDDLVIWDSQLMCAWNLQDLCCKHVEFGLLQMCSHCPHLDELSTDSDSSSSSPPPPPPLEKWPRVFEAYSWSTAAAGGATVRKTLVIKLLNLLHRWMLETGNPIGAAKAVPPEAPLWPRRTARMRMQSTNTSSSSGTWSSLVMGGFNLRFCAQLVAAAWSGLLAQFVLGQVIMFLQREHLRSSTSLRSRISTSLYSSSAATAAVWNSVSIGDDDLQWSEDLLLQ